jgi:hypothetical protein
MGYLYLYETKIQVLEFYFKRQYLAPWCRVNQGTQFELWLLVYFLNTDAMCYYCNRLVVYIVWFHLAHLVSRQLCCVKKTVIQLWWT